MTKADILKSLVGFQSLRSRIPILYYAADNAGKLLGPDDVATFVRILQGLAKESKIDVILHTDGGAIASAKRLAFSLRELTDDIRVLVPVKAKSAGTIIAISANKIEMGFAAEIGAIDPFIRTARDNGSHGPDSISSEDIRLMADMCKDWFGMDSKSIGPSVLQALSQKIFPTTLSSFYRSHKSIHHTCEMLLRYQLPDSTIKRRRMITENLVSGPREHNDPILWAEALNIGLAVSQFDEETGNQLRDMFAVAKTLCVNFVMLERSESSANAIIATPSVMFQNIIDTRTSTFVSRGWLEC